MEQISLSREEIQEMCERAASIAIERFTKANKTEFLTREQVAKRLKVDKSTLWRWHQSGFLRGVKLGGRVVYSEDLVRRFEHGEMIA